MANIRLFGLVLIITSLILGMAAVATQTTTIRIGDFGILGKMENDGSGNYDREVKAVPGEVDFVSVPVAYPLIAACGLGLAMWFLPELANSKKPVQWKSNGRRRRRR